MSARNNDPKGRYRSETIAYRCSPEERKELDKRWRLLGYGTKQDYVLDAVLHNNIEREQVSVNKRRCLILEHKTMMYVIFIAMDLMLMILYCIIMKLLALQIMF